MLEELKKILKIARKTGDKVIVLDPDGGNPFVVIDFAAYEAILESQKKPQRAVENKRLTGNKREDNIVLASPSSEKPSLAEPSEEDVIDEEQFLLEPIE